MPRKTPPTVDERGRQAVRALYVALDRARLALHDLDRAREELDRAANTAARLRVVVTEAEGNTDG